MPSSNGVNPSWVFAILVASVKLWDVVFNTQKLNIAYKDISNEANFILVKYPFSVVT